MLNRERIFMDVSADREMLFRVLGNSMYPTLLNNDVVSVIVCEEYCVNDILVVNCIDHLMIHRIIKTQMRNDEMYYLTKGDNNNFIDRWCSSKAVIGKVVKVNHMPLGNMKKN